MIFKLFDKEKKGFLYIDEAINLLEFFRKSFQATDLMTIEKPQSDAFIERWKTQFSKMNKIGLADVIEIQDDEIFQTIGSRYIAIHRRNTALNVVGQLEKIE